MASQISRAITSTISATYEELFNAMSFAFKATEPSSKISITSVFNGTSISSSSVASSVFYRGFSDFLISLKPPTSRELSQYSLDDLDVYPLFLSGILPATNIPGLTADDPFCLSRSTLLDIFEANILYWNDNRILQDNAVYPATVAKIQALYASLTTPLRITVVVRKDSALMTGSFTALLKSISDSLGRNTTGFVPGNIWTLRHSRFVDSQTNISYFQQFLGNFGALLASQNIPGAISYGQWNGRKTLQTDASSGGLRWISLINVAQTGVSFNSLVAQEMIGSFTSNFVENPAFEMPIDGSGNHSWPVTNMLYFVVRRQNSTLACAERAQVVKFALWIYSAAQQIEALISPYGFVSLPSALTRTYYRSLQSRITCQDPVTKQTKLAYMNTIPVIAPEDQSVVLPLLIEAFEFKNPETSLALATTDTSTAKNAIDSVTSGRSGVAFLPTDVLTRAVTQAGNLSASLVHGPAYTISLGVIYNHPLLNASTPAFNVSMDLFERILLGEVGTWEHTDILAENAYLQQLASTFPSLFSTRHIIQVALKDPGATGWEFDTLYYGCSSDARRAALFSSSPALDGSTHALLGLRTVPAASVAASISSSTTTLLVNVSSTVDIDAYVTNKPYSLGLRYRIGFTSLSFARLYKKGFGGSVSATSCLNSVALPIDPSDSSISPTYHVADLLSSSQLAKLNDGTTFVSSLDYSKTSADCMPLTQTMSFVTKRSFSPGRECVDVAKPLFQFLDWMTSVDDVTALAERNKLLGAREVASLPSSLLAYTNRVLLRDATCQPFTSTTSAGAGTSPALAGTQADQVILSSGPCSPSIDITATTGSYPLPTGSSLLPPFESNTHCKDGMMSVNFYYVEPRRCTSTVGLPDPLLTPCSHFSPVDGTNIGVSLVAMTVLSCCLALSYVAFVLRYKKKHVLFAASIPVQILTQVLIVIRSVCALMWMVPEPNAIGCSLSFLFSEVCGNVLPYALVIPMFMQKRTLESSTTAYKVKNALLALAFIGFANAVCLVSINSWATETHNNSPYGIMTVERPVLSFWSVEVSSCGIPSVGLKIGLALIYLCIAFTSVWLGFSCRALARHIPHIGDGLQAVSFYCFLWLPQIVMRDWISDDTLTVDVAHGAATFTLLLQNILFTIINGVPKYLRLRNERAPLTPKNHNQQNKRRVSDAGASITDDTIAEIAGLGSPRGSIGAHVTLRSQHDSMLIENYSSMIKDGKSLGAILRRDIIFREKFREFMVLERSEENLIFLDFIERFKAETNAERQREYATEIIILFLRTESPYQVNVSHHTITAAKRRALANGLALHGSQNGKSAGKKDVVKNDVSIKAQTTMAEVVTPTTNGASQANGGPSQQAPKVHPQNDDNASVASEATSSSSGASDALLGQAATLFGDLAHGPLDGPPQSIKKAKPESGTAPPQTGTAVAPASAAAPLNCTVPVPRSTAAPHVVNTPPQNSALLNGAAPPGSTPIPDRSALNAPMDKSVFDDIVKEVLSMAFDTFIRFLRVSRLAGLGGSNGGRRGSRGSICSVNTLDHPLATGAQAAGTKSLLGGR